MSKALANKIFLEILEQAPSAEFIPKEKIKPKSRIVCLDDFFKVLIEANETYNKTFNIPEKKQLVFSEDYYGELIQLANNEGSSTDIKINKTFPDLRIVTYLCHEAPGIISTHTLSSDGIRELKHRVVGYYDDPDFTGYSIIRSQKTIQANITFKVWGKYFQDIRERSKLLREIIRSNVWYFKQCGLGEIVWTGSIEEEEWDGKNIAKFKSDKYLIKFTEIIEQKEKNLEQIVIQSMLG